MRFLAIGECMAELAPAGGAARFTLGFAGDTFNTAWYMAQLAPDLQVDYLSAVGDDRISADMRAFMRSSGIGDTHVAQRSGETVGLYMIHLDEGERSFSYWRGQSAARQLADDPAALDRAMDGADMIYVSGISLAILDTASRERLLDALARHRLAGRTIAFDPNLRPRLWSSTDEMTTTVTKAAQHADIILPSYDDEAQWFGDQTPLQTLHRYGATRARQIIVKNGAGSVLYRDNGTDGEMAVVPATSVVDTTAAGDSFNAALLQGILAGKSLTESISNGCRLAAHVVREKGALVPSAVHAVS